MNDFLVAVFVFVLGFVVVCGTAFGLGYLWEVGVARSACLVYGEQTGLSVTHHWANGCMVTLPDGTTVPRKDAERIIVRKYSHRNELTIKQGEQQ